MSKFKALKEILEDVAPAIAKEGEEAAASIASKTATADEKAYLDMVKQQLAERDAFKSEFNLPTAHGTSSEKILKNMNILDEINLKNKLGVDSSLDIPISKVPVFEEFKPNDSFNGMGIFSHPYDRTQESYMGPNYKPNEYATGKGSFVIPMRVRGAKTFNYDGHIHHKEAGLIPTVQESFEKLSKLTGKSVEELKDLGSYEVRKLVEKYPKDFENFTFQGQVVTFKPENIRGEFAEYDPLKRKSRNYMDSIVAATTGAGAYSALSPESAEASEASSKMPTKEEMLKDYVATRRWPETPREESRAAEDRRLSKERTQEFEKNISEDIGPIGSLGYNLIKGLLFDERPPEEFEEGGGGVYESTSPIDFITPAGVGATAKGISKAFTRPIIRKAVVSEVLPATRFEKIKQAIPSSTIEGKVVTPQLAAEERLALPAPATEEPLGLPMPKQELPAPSTKSIEAMPIAESPVALERAVEAETPAIVSSKPIARAKKSAVSQEPEPDRFIIPGMFLKTEQLIRQKMGKSASPQQIMGVLREAKPEELEYLGIPEFLEGQDKVTKEALLEHIKKNSPNLEEIPTKTLGFPLEEKTLLEQKESLIEEANGLFRQTLDSTGSLIDQLKQHGYNTNDALDIIDKLKEGSTEALQTFKNISPNLAEAAASYLDIELQHSSIQEKIKQINNALETINIKDFPPQAKYYKLPREQTITLEHPKSEETYKERLYSISKPRTEIRGDNIQVTSEGAKIYDEYQPEIEKAKRELEQYERSIEIPAKEIQEKINKATEYNREIDETLKKEFIKYYDNKYPERVGTPMDGRSTFNIAHGSSFNYLSEVDTIEKKIAFIRGMHLPLDKHFIDSFIQNISSNKQYIDNLKTIKDGVKSLIDYTNKLFEYKESLGDLQNASYDALRQHGRGFQGPHWDEPNVFAHTRSTEFTAPNGQRHLFAQELQSDWHQKIRDQIKKIQKAEKQLEILESKGQGPKYDFRDFSLVRGGSDSYSEIENYINYLKKELKEIPKAPMNRTWHEFLAKRLLKDAAEGDFDNISWTTGDTQNERYNLEKFFSKITYNPETKNLVIFDLDGEVVTNRTANPEVLPDYIGEELSEKLLSTEPFGHQGHFLSGEGLKTGGEGMRGFYDEIIPTTMAKFGKKYGVKPEKVMMPDVGEIWTMKLTPEMKEYIKKYGFPMFMLPGFMQQEEVPEEKKEFKNINKLVKDKK